MIRAISCASLLTLLSIPVPAAAQDSQAASSTTRLIPFSATLPDAGPDTIAGARWITFALFDDAEGGTRLWSETQTVNVDARGRYAAHLGAVTPLPLEIFRAEQARWLEVTVEGTALPRTMLVAVPYALRAADAETLDGTPASEFVRTDANGRRIRADGATIDDPLVDGTGVPNQIAKWNGSTTLSSSIITESFDNRIGILAPDPTGGGVVDSRFTIRHLDGNTALGILNTSNQRRFALNIQSNGGWTLYDGFAGSWNAGINQLGGSVAIGGPHSARLAVYQLDEPTVAVLGTSTAGTGVRGLSTSHIAVDGDSTTGTGVRGDSSSGAGVWGSTASGVAVRGTNAVGGGTAGQFVGNVTVSGTLTKGGGAFQIDHPLDPANKYLQHSFVESPDMMNVYNGNVTLDARGEAWVTLPEWFEALNRDFRYQLTAVGAPGPNLYIASKMSGNRFKIAGGVPDGEVSWQVTGIRQDAWANANRIPVEHDKPAAERGFYLHPKAFDLPADMAIPSLRMETMADRPRKPQ